jgi:hypothetical protein
MVDITPSISAAKLQQKLRITTVYLFFTTVWLCKSLKRVKSRDSLPLRKDGWGGLRVCVLLIFHIFTLVCTQKSTQKIDGLELNAYLCTRNKIF